MPPTGKIVILAMLISLQSPPGHADIREDFHDHNPTKEHLTDIINSDSYGNSPLTLAYKGLCETMLAEHAFLPTSKLSSFNTGKQKIESAISQNKRSCELRYIRLMIQLNTPRFLGYHDDIATDLEYFISTINEQIDNKWRTIFVDNLLQGKHLEQKHRDQLLALKKQLS